MYKVLLVDDEKQIIEGLTVVIDWHRLNCTIVGAAYNGNMGVEKALQVRPDIIITDIRMPYMDGIEMISKIQLNQPHIKCIILSGYSEFNYAKEGMRLGAKHYILKPVEQSELEESIHTVVNELNQEKKQSDEWELLFQERINQELPSNLKPDVVEEVKAYLHQNYADYITLASIAEQFYISPNYLSQLFRKKTGETFLGYLTKIRIEKAKNLLANTDYKIYEIRTEIGYDDAKHFRKTFENMVGMSPSEYKTRGNQSE